MVCSKCGKQLEDESMFCTECGNAVGFIENLSDPDKTINDNKFIKGINNFIETFGEDKINKYLSVVAIVSMLAIRVFGFIFTAIVITAVNGYLIYYNYEKTSKADLKIIVWSVAVLLTGILIWLQSRIMFI